jgi:hypothetical protein
MRYEAENAYRDNLAARKEVERRWRASAPAERPALKEEWHAYDAAVQESERDLQAFMTPTQPQQFTPEEIKWAQRRPDLVAHPNFMPTAAFYHDHITKNMGVPRGTKAYTDLMTEALEPGGDYQPQPTPDDIVENIRKTSKYGKDFTANDYNRGVVKMEKERGER